MGYLDGLKQMLTKPFRKRCEMVDGLLFIGLLFDTGGNVAQPVWSCTNYHAQCAFLDLSLTISAHLRKGVAGQEAYLTANSAGSRAFASGYYPRR